MHKLQAYTVKMHHKDFIHRCWFQLKNEQTNENLTCLQEEEIGEKNRWSLTVRLSSLDLLQEGRQNRSQKGGKLWRKQGTEISQVIRNLNLKKTKKTP